MVKFRIGLFGMVALSACMDLAAVPEDGRACSTEVYLGSFRGRAAGASSDTLMGCAFFTTDTLSQQFGMMLTNGGPFSKAPTVKLFRSRRPVAGVLYSVGVTGDMSGVMFLGAKTYTLTSGTFRTKSDDYMPSIYAGSYFLDGVLDVTATDTAGAILSVTGAFKAICVGDQENSGVGSSGDPIQKKVKACDPTYAGIRAASGR